MNLIIRLLLNASVFLLVSRVVPGFQVASLWTALWAALIFGFVNALIRPILLAVSLPLSILTLGLFTLVVDAGVMALTAWLVPGFDVHGFLAALLGWVLVSLGSMVVSSLLGDNGAKRA
ncbi:MAG TPA: phage holin family protein [Clostridia bacterium]|nr:phage holin family protein [Clostridia bacterium]